ncbi:MAG: ABC transporter ATP-binding protein [Desulfurococcaceae archaeon]
MSKIILSLENLSKRIGNDEIISDVNLSIEAGSIVSLLGPPGAGKTTLLRIIAGLDAPTKGRIYIDGEDVTNLPAHLRPVAMVFQSFALFPNMSVYDNIAHPLKRLKQNKADIQKRVIEIAEMLGIREVLYRKPNELSGGQMQRVAIARALAKDAKVYLMDEPFTNLDAKIREMLRVELKRMQEKLGITILLATPDPVEALTIGGKVAVLNKGKVLQFGHYLEVYENPANTFVGEYFGYPSMNLVKGTISKVGDKTYIQTPLFTIPVTGSLSELDDKEVIIGVRPDTVKINGEGDINFECEILIVEIVGSDTIVHIPIASEERTFKIFIPGEIRKYETGEKIKCSINLENIYVFHVKDGKYLNRLDKLIRK